MVSSNFAQAKMQGARPPSDIPVTHRTLPTDGEEELPPPYTLPPSGASGSQPTSAPTHLHTPGASNIPSSTASSSTSSAPITLGTLHTAGPLYLYSASALGSSDFILSPSQDRPAIFHLSTHGLLSSQADVTLHYNATNTSKTNRKSPTIACVDFQPYSSQFTIQLYDPADASRQTGGVTVMRQGYYSNCTWSFQVLVPETGHVERFEWRRNDTPLIRELGGSIGMECLTSAGQIVAVWARIGGMRKVGRLRFFPRRGGAFVGDGRLVADEGWGDGLEGMILMALFGLREQEKRARKDSY